MALLVAVTKVVLISCDSFKKIVVIALFDVFPPPCNLSMLNYDITTDIVVVKDISTISPPRKYVLSFPT
jgi:hypothetical protein